MEALQVCSMAGEPICSVPVSVSSCEDHCESGLARFYNLGCSSEQTVRNLRAHVAREMGCDVGNITLTLDSRVLTDGEQLQRCLDQHGFASHQVFCIHQSTFDIIHGNWIQVEPPTEKGCAFSIVDGCITTSDGAQEVIQEIDELTVKIQRGRLAYNEAFEGKLVDGKLVWTFISSVHERTPDDKDNLFFRWVMEREVLEEVTVKKGSDPALNVLVPKASRQKRNRDAKRVCSSMTKMGTICSEGHNTVHKNQSMLCDSTDSSEDYEEYEHETHEAQVEILGSLANVLGEAYINVKSRSLLKQQDRQKAKRRLVRRALVEELLLPKTVGVRDRVLEKAATQQRWARQDRSNQKKRNAQRAVKLHLQCTESPCI